MLKNNAEKLTDKVFMRLFVTSLLCIFACAVCIVSVSFALYTDTLETNSVVIKSASYDVTVSSENTGTLQKNEDGLYECEADVEYTVTLLATGTADKGYAVVTLSPVEIYYSTVLAPGETVSFKIKRSENYTFGVRGHWGEYNGSTFADGENL
jgi:hypothetical protein